MPWINFYFVFGLLNKYKEKLNIVKNIYLEIITISVQYMFVQLFYKKK